ncbi:MAG: DNA polymerase III subunit delta [Candidatus Omnitrophota bacterium]|nr:DNA polymerase III subunit delta [Candidatus Omnitrophota bacterium]
MVYLFEGEEDFLKEEAIRELEGRLFKNGTEEFNKTTFYGQDMDGSELASVAAVLPMLSQQRLIIIKGAEKLSSAAKKSFISYLKKPSPSTCLILDAKVLSKRDRLYNAISQHGRINTFKKYYSGQVDKWIVKRAHSYKKKILPQAVAALQENVGDSLRFLDQAVKKLVLYIGDSEVIKVKDVEEIIGKSSTATIFDLIEAIRQKQRSKALKILSELTEENKEISRIIGMLFWQLKRIKQAKALLGQKVSSKEIGRQLRVHRFFLDRFIAEVKDFSSREFSRHFKFLLEADTEIKKGIKKPQIALELLVIKLCGL